MFDNGGLCGPDWMVNVMNSLKSTVLRVLRAKCFGSKKETIQR
jgi:hypothetical protein